jgi:hypothetical protein
VPVDRATKRIRPQDFELSQVQDNLGNALDGVLDTLNKAGFRRSLDMGQFWSRGGMPTAFTSMQRAIVAGSNYNVCGAFQLMPSAGSVLSMQGVANGGVSGSWTLCLYLNGKATGLAVTSTDTKMMTSVPRATLKFAAGDIFNVCIKGSNANIDQAFMCTLDIESQG